MKPRPFKTTVHPQSPVALWPWPDGWNRAERKQQIETYATSTFFVDKILFAFVRKLFVPVACTVYLLKCNLLFI